MNEVKSLSRNEKILSEAQSSANIKNGVIREFFHINSIIFKDNFLSINNKT